MRARRSWRPVEESRSVPRMTTDDGAGGGRPRRRQMIGPVAIAIPERAGRRPPTAGDCTCGPSSSSTNEFLARPRRDAKAAAGAGSSSPLVAARARDTAPSRRPCASTRTRRHDASGAAAPAPRHLGLRPRRGLPQQRIRGPASADEARASRDHRAARISFAGRLRTQSWSSRRSGTTPLQRAGEAPDVDRVHHVPEVQVPCR